MYRRFKFKRKLMPYWSYKYASTVAQLRRFSFHTKLAISNYITGALHRTKGRQKMPFVFAGAFLYKLAKLIKADLSLLVQRQVRLKYTFVFNNTITSEVLLQYILARLDKLYLPREIIPRLITKFEGRKPFMKEGKLEPRRPGMFGKNVLGFMVKCAGRFTRAQMASRAKFQGGKMPLSSISKNVFYSFGTISLKLWRFGVESLFVKTKWGILK